MTAAAGTTKSAGERPPHKNRIWKTAQLICYIGGGVAAVVASVAVGNAVSMFGQKCPLDARLVYNVNATAHKIRIAIESADHWSSKSICDASTFIPVFCAAYAFILAYFVMMCDRVEKVAHGSGSRNRMLGLFMPMLLSSVLLSILMLVASTQTSNGTSVFCQGLLDSASIQCDQAHLYDWPDDPDAKFVYVTLVTAVTSSWISFVGCLLSSLVLILRCFRGVDRVPSSDTHRPVPLRVASPSSTTSYSSPLLLGEEFEEGLPGPSKTSSPVHPQHVP